MTTDSLLALPLFIGLLLGTGYFQVLWWTVQRGVASPRPALWFLLSPMLRVTLVLAGMYGMSQGDWHRTLACLTGFIIARTVLLGIRRTAVTS